MVLPDLRLPLARLLSTRAISARFVSVHVSRMSLKYIYKGRLNQV